MTFFDTDTDAETLIEDLPPLRTTWHEEVKELKEKRKEKRQELEDLKEQRRRSYARKAELENEFEAALNGKSDRDPRKVREERLKVEEEADSFQEKRLILKHEVAETEVELEETAEETAEEIADELEEKVLPPLKDLTEKVQEMSRALLPINAVLDEVAHNDRSTAPPGRARINPPWSRDIFGKMNRLRRAAASLLDELQEDGHDVDSDLMSALNDL